MLPYNRQPTYSAHQNYQVIQNRTPVPTPAQHHPTLPYPSHILPSQSSPSGPCIACGKPQCQLQSHRHFTNYVLEDAKKKRLSGTIGDTTPRPKTAVLVPPPSEGSIVQPQLGLDAERHHLLALWSMEWSPVKRGPERHLFPTRFIDKVLPIACNYAPLLQATLAYSGTLWAIANNVVSDVATRQQGNAVEMLSQECPTEQEASADEAMLAATLLLLIYMAQGNGFEVGKHVSGLVHLANIRGGPHYLGLSGLVAEMLIHADHMQAIFFNHEPVWRFPLPPLDIGSPNKLGQGFQRALAHEELDESLAMAAQSICKVADVLELASSSTPMQKNVKHGFGYLSMIAEYQLALCNAAFHASSSRSECICLALILFNHVVLNNDGAITPGILQLEHRFWQALQAAEAKGMTLSMLPGLYVWMVLMGLTLCIRTESQYRIVGVEKLRAMRLAAGITTWSQLKSRVLDDFVWLATAQEETFRDIWLEVEGMQSTDPPTPSSISNGKMVGNGRPLRLVPPSGM